MDRMSQLASTALARSPDRRELLPKIDLAISESPTVFLNRMAAIGRKSGTFSVECHSEALGDRSYCITNFRNLNPTIHAGLGGQLISWSDVKGRIQVEMRAETWSPDPPTRTAYCEAAKLVFGALLASYNRAYRRRYRLRIERAQRAGVRASATTKRLFNRFAILANTSSLHPLDWRRFYELVKLSRQKLDEHDLATMLQRAHFSAEKAEKLAEIYHHLWNFKRLK